MPNTIILKGDLGSRYEEGRAAGVIKPGHLIQMNTAGALVVHATAGGAGVAAPERAFAIEDALQGKTIDDAYASGDLVRYFIAQPGDQIYGILKAGQNADENSPLASAGDGTLRVATTTDIPIGRCVEALDLSGGGAVDTFVKLRIQ